MKRGRGNGGRLIYLTDVDISVDNGPGINEREFVRCILDTYGKQVTCMVPEPACAENYYDSRIRYIRRHARWKAVGHCKYVADSLVELLGKGGRKGEALIARPTIMGIEPIIFHYIRRRPVFIKKLGGYAIFGKSGRDWRRDLGARVLLSIHRHMASAAAICDVESETYLEWVAWRYGIPKDKLFVVRNGANTETFKPMDPGEAGRAVGLNVCHPLVGYTGALRDLRNIEMLIESVRVLNSTRRVYCMIVGDGPQRAELKRLACSAGLEKEVIFTGSVSYAEVPKYIALFDVAVDLTVVPLSIGGGVRYASFSQKIAQYLACGKPVVAWDIVDNKFIEENSLGALAEPLRIESLCRAMTKVMHGEFEDSAVVGEKARAYATEHLSVARVTERRIREWMSILGNESIDRTKGFRNSRFTQLRSEGRR